MLHVYINEVSPALLQSIHHVQDALRTGDTALLLRGMELNFDTIKEMNRRRQEMWKASNPKRYNDFRVFIMVSYSWSVIPITSYNSNGLYYVQLQRQQGR